MRRRVRIIGLFLLLAFSEPIRGQIADTLDPRGYLPLKVGNVWEYEHDLVRPATSQDPVDRSETRYERLRVAGSSLRSDTLWYLIDFQERSVANELLDYRRFDVRYDSASASVVGGPEVFGALRCLDSAFGVHDPGPYYCWPFVSQDEILLTDLFGPEPVQVKSLFSYVWGVTVVHGIGPVYMGGGCEPCGPFDDSDHWKLKYAVVGDLSYGRQIVQVDADLKNARPALQVYPNPTFGRLTVIVGDDNRVDVFNIIGQRVRTESFGISGEVQLSLTGLPTGFYVVRAGGETAVVLLR